MGRGGLRPNRRKVEKSLAHISNYEWKIDQLSIEGRAKDWECPVCGKMRVRVEGGRWNCGMCEAGGEIRELATYYQLSMARHSSLSNFYREGFLSLKDKMEGKDGEKS